MGAQFQFYRRRESTLPSLKAFMVLIFVEAVLGKMFVDHFWFSWLIRTLVPLVVPFLLLAVIKQLWSYYITTCCCEAGWEDTPLPEGDCGWPLIGETFTYALKGLRMNKECFDKYGNVFRTHLFGRPTVRVRGRENLRKILHGENEIVSSLWPTSTREILGARSVTQSQGPEHAQLRKFVLAGFSHRNLSTYLRHIQSLTREMVDSWCRQDSVVAYDELKCWSFRLATRIICGLVYDLEESRYLAGVHQTMESNVLSIPIDLPGFGFRKGIRARNILLDRIEKNLRAESEKKENVKGNDNDNDNDFIDVLHRIIQDAEEEEGVAMDIERAKQIALDLVHAGTTTSASAAVMLICNLTSHPEVMQKIRKELEEHGHLECNKPLYLNDVNRLKYLHYVVLESLRSCPIVPGAVRTVLKTFEIEGKKVPKGWTLIYSIRDTILDDRYTSEPDKFDPERFGDMYEMNHSAYQSTFGGGSRGCPGKSFAILNLKTLVIELARSCTWELLSPESYKLKLWPVPHPRDKLPVRFSKFDHNSNTVATTIKTTAHSELPIGGKEEKTR